MNQDMIMSKHTSSLQLQSRPLSNPHIKFPTKSSFREYLKSTIKNNPPQSSDYVEFYFIRSYERISGLFAIK